MDEHCCVGQAAVPCAWSPELDKVSVALSADQVYVVNARSKNPWKFRVVERDQLNLIESAASGPARAHSAAVEPPELIKVWSAYPGTGCSVQTCKLEHTHCAHYVPSVAVLAWRATAAAAGRAIGKGMGQPQVVTHFMKYESGFQRPP